MKLRGELKTYTLFKILVCKVGIEKDKKLINMQSNESFTCILNSYRYNLNVFIVATFLITNI
jgi:hypothetical protein